MRSASWGSSGPHDYRTPQHPGHPTDRNVFPFMVLAGARINQIPPRPMRPAQIPGMPPRRVHGPIPNCPDTTPYRFGPSKIKPAVSAADEHHRLGPSDRSPERRRPQPVCQLPPNSDAAVSAGPVWASRPGRVDTGQTRPNPCRRRTGLPSVADAAGLHGEEGDPLGYRHDRARSGRLLDRLPRRPPTGNLRPGPTRFRCSVPPVHPAANKTLRPLSATDERRPARTIGKVGLAGTAGLSSARTRPVGPSQRPTNAAEPGPSAR